MHTWMRIFVDAGWPAYPIALLGLTGAAVGVFAAVSGKLHNPGAARLSAATLWVSAASLFTGAAGVLLGRSVVEEALKHVDPADIDLIRAVGYTEARGCATLALALAVLPTALAGLSALWSGAGPSRASRAAALLGCVASGFFFLQPIPNAQLAEAAQAQEAAQAP